MADETINVGDRVRLKGDHGPAPLWMTVARADDLQADPQKGIMTSGRYLDLAYWTRNENDAPVLVKMSGIMAGAVTTNPHEAVSGSMKLRRAR